MKKILVPVDFSPASRNASEYAALLAKVFGAEIQLLHVHKDLIPATVGPEPWTVTVSNVQTKNEEQMNREIDFLSKKYSIKVNGDVRRGFKANSINKFSKEIAAGLIIMVVKSDKKSKTAGGTILKTLRKTTIPTLIIPEEAAYAPIKSIVLAVDFDEVTPGSCLEPLFEIIKAFDASLRVLHVDRKGADINPSEMSAKLELGRILGKVSYLYDKIENEDVEQGIQHFIQNHPTHLLVMIARHHNVVERLFGTIHTRSMSFKIPLPLLIIKNK